MTGLVDVARRQARKQVRRARRAAEDPHYAAYALRTKAARAIAPKTDAPPLPPRVALRENGFVIHRGLFSPEECARLAARFKDDAGIVDGVHFTRTDATNKIPSTREVLFDDRILGAARGALGQDVRFLQPSDVHYLHDTPGWHRDSVHRARDSSSAPDWNTDQGEFGVVKVILYLESDNAAMGILPGSHRSPLEPDLPGIKSLENAGRHVVIDANDNPNRRLSAAEKRRPFAWRALVGDVLVFDQRMYHAGRRVDDGKVTKDRDAAKMTLSLVFGTDNMHSDRFYSYFRFARREIGYHAFDAQFRAQLEAHDLILDNGLGNYYEDHPEELRLATLRKPETLEGLIEEFTQAGQARRASRVG